MAKEAKESVKIFSTPTCMYCEMAKDFFDENGVKYESYDVSTDLAKRKEMVEKSGQLGVPVILIKDQVIVGFDEDRLKELLEIK
jgi:glutaredoxin-like YruB-family protein